MPSQATTAHSVVSVLAALLACTRIELATPAYADGTGQDGTDTKATDQYGRTSLMLAADAGDTHAVEMLLAAGADVEITDHSGETALHHAARGGHAETARLLLDHHARVSAKDAGGDTPIMIAAHEGHTETVRLLLDRGADPLEPAQWLGFGGPPLVIAAEEGHTETVKVLLDAKGVQVDMCRVSALWAAASKGHTETVALLLAHGARVNDRCAPSDASALDVAAEGGHTDTVNLLVQHGAEVNRPDETGQMPLMLAAKGCHTDTVSALIAHGADVSTKGKLFGQTALAIAAARGCDETVKVLVKSGADLEAKQDPSGLHAFFGTALPTPGKNSDTTGWTPIMTAAAEDGASVPALVHAGADVNRADRYGQTALLIAAREAHYAGKAEVVSALLAGGANANAHDVDGWTALMYAAKGGNVEMTNALLAHGADVTVKNRDGDTALMLAEKFGQSISGESGGRLMYSGRQEHAAVVDALVVHSGDVWGNADPPTALLIAARAGYPDAVEGLLRTGVDANAGAGAVLRAAARQGHTACVEALLAHGANTELGDEGKWTALMYAADGGHVATLKTLLAHGAAVNVTDTWFGWKRTPLTYAAAGGHADVIDTLFAAGAQLSPRQATDALQLAVYGHHTEAVKALLQHGVPADDDNLGAAAEHGDAAIVTALIDRGANVNSMVRAQYSGSLPLQRAAATNHPEVVEILLKRGASVNATDQRGQTALTYARRNNASTAVKILLEHGAVDPPPVQSR